MNATCGMNISAVLFLDFFLLLGPVAGPGLAAQESTIITDEEALFGEDAPDTLAPVPSPADTGDPTRSGSGTVTSSSNATAAFLKRDQVRIGGSFTGKLGTSFSWTNPWKGNQDPLNPDNLRLDPTIASTIFFDARPEEDLRIYGSVKTAWPFSGSYNFLTSANYENTPTPPVETISQSFSAINLQIFELFADFSWNDATYFRFGKHTVKWGVGYFFSPADILNLTAIDVTDPTAQREGPISLRALIPIPDTQNNLWGYLILPGSLTGSSSSGTGSFKPQDMGYAGKVEFILENYEIGFGGFYQHDRAPRLMATTTGAMGHFDLFAEVVASWGNDRTYITALDPLATEIQDGRWYYQGTLGFLYTGRDGYTSIAAQYYYNGEGYSYDKRDRLVDQFTSQPQIIQDSLAPVLTGALSGASQHYGALSISRSELFIKDLSASLLVMANLADLSGFITPTIQYRVFKYMNLSLSPSFIWYINGLWGTGKNSEYLLLHRGPSVTINLSAGLGSSRF